jgi:hypothetical protein
MSHNLKVGAKEHRSVECFESKLKLSCLIISWNDVKNESQCQKEGRVNSFDSATVKVKVRKAILFGFFDDDLRDEVP